MKAFADMDKAEREELLNRIPGMLEGIIPADCKYVLAVSADGLRGSCVSNMLDPAAAVRLLRNASAPKRLRRIMR